MRSFPDPVGVTYRLRNLCEGTKMRKTNAETEETCDTSDILLWALFANRKELAEIFWIKGEDHLCKFAFRIS